MLKTTSNEINLGALTWTATADPSGTISKLIRWNKVGKVISFWVSIIASTPGTLVTAVEFDLPSNMPSPSTWSSQPNDSIIMLGVAKIGVTTNPTFDFNDGLKVYKDISGNFKIKIECVGGPAADTVYGHGNYISG